MPRLSFYDIKKRRQSTKGSTLENLIEKTEAHIHFQAKIATGIKEFLRQKIVETGGYQKVTNLQNFHEEY